jgi:hypothetical protein
LNINCTTPAAWIIPLPSTPGDPSIVTAGAARAVTDVMSTRQKLKDLRIATSLDASDVLMENPRDLREDSGSKDEV